MMLVEETSVPSEALPVEEFKAHLRLGTGFADDNLQDPVLDSFLRAAMAAIEARTGKILIAREFSWSLTSWRDASGQAFPIAPVAEIVEVALIDDADVETVLAASTYRLERDHHRPKLVPYGTTLPNIPKRGSVEIVFVAGFAPIFGELPADLAQAVFLLAAHYYEHRSETGLNDGGLPYGVAVLIERYKTLRLLAGGRA